MNREEYFQVGFIMKPHGLKGEVTISLDRYFSADWEKLKTVFVEKKGQLVPYFIEYASQQKDKVYTKFEDVSNASEAKALQKLSLFLPLSQRPKLHRGDFYNDEITGFEVADEKVGVLGKIKAVEEAGPNRFLIVAYDQREIMIPVNGPFIISINKSKKRIRVNLPVGFLDI